MSTLYASATAHACACDHIFENEYDSLKMKKVPLNSEKQILNMCVQFDSLGRQDICFEIALIVSSNVWFAKGGMS